MKEATLKRGRERSILRFHPWIFSGALESADAGIAPGEIVLVRSSSGEALGFGSYSPASNIRVRLVSYSGSVLPDREYISSLVRSSISRRGALAANCGARLINAENDFLPGLIADYYSGYVVLELTSHFAEKNLDVIVEAIKSALPDIKAITARRDATSRSREALEVFAPDDAFELLCGEEPPELIEIDENGVKILVDIRKGHKTGFYLDQRDARALVGSLSRGKDVLNTFCYTGAFGLHALKNGAKSVVQVDSSSLALETARKNFAFNFPDSGAMDFVEADVFKYLRKCRDSRSEFDLIVLDPPKFADTKHRAEKAAAGYKDINLLAMKLLRPGGILATFSCSGAISSAFFDQILFEAATDARREFQIIARTGAAADHPARLSFPEGSYLKGVVLKRC